MNVLRKNDTANSRTVRLVYIVNVDVIFLNSRFLSISTSSGKNLRKTDSRGEHLYRGAASFDEGIKTTVEVIKCKSKETGPSKETVPSKETGPSNTSTACCYCSQP